MLIRPWLLYFRRRIFASAIFSLLAACVAHMWVSGDGLLDFKIFWRGFCGCPVDSKDAYFLLNLPAVVALIVGLTFGFASPGAVYGAGASATPDNQFKALGRFFLTRPVSRTRTFLWPQALAAAAIAIFPALAFSLLIGWLRLIDAPSLHHLMATIRIIPAASGLKQHPSFFQVLGSLNATRRYLAATSVGFCAYAALASQQWLLLSPSKKLNALGAAPVFLLFGPLWLIVGGHTANIFLAPGRGMPLSYMPSILGIVLHYGIAVLIAFGCWRIVRNVEL